ncbi:MAG: thiamine pyrophosphate-binding protein [Marinilabilia sp.]
MKRRVVNIIVEQLVKENTKYIFGVTGKAISPLIDATLDFEEIAFIPARHESGAALMAYGYAQGSGHIGVCCATTGGGSTNLATGVATAYMNSVPMLVITGQVSTGEYGKGAFQESTGLGQTIDVVDFFESMTKASFSVESPGDAPNIINHAIAIATSGRRGPVHINLPFDIQHAEISNELPERIVSGSSKGARINKILLKEAVNLFESSQKPVILIGWGGVLSGAAPVLTEMAEKLNIPVATTLQGKGAIEENHPLYLGYLGLFGHPVVAEYIFEECDLLVAVGTDFDEFTSFNWDERFRNNKDIIQIDIDPDEIGKNYPVRVGLQGDAHHISIQLKQRLEDSSLGSKPSGNAIMEKIRSQGRVINPKSVEDNGVPIKPQRLMKEISDSTPENTLFLADSGSHCVWALHYLPVRRGGGFYPNQSLGAMGASICASMGVKLSKPEHPVICICGDGSFLMSGNEIATAGQLQIPVVWIILNDSKYNLPALSLKKMFNREVGVELNQTDFSAFAKALNVEGYRIEKPGELEGILDEVLKSNQPAVIDVVIDSDEVPPIGARKLK